MSMRNLFLLAGLLAASPGYAAIVSLVAKGPMHQYLDPHGMLPFPQPLPATEFVLNLSFDDATEDLNSEDPKIGIYRPAISAMSLTIDGMVVPTVMQPRGILVWNDRDLQGLTGDLWQALTETTSTGPDGQVLWVEIALTFVDTTGRMLSDDSLIVPVISGYSPNWEIRYLIHEMTETGEFVTWARAAAGVASLTTVPLPATGWLLAAGSILLGWRRYRKTPA